MALKHLSTREMVKYSGDLLSTAPPPPGEISKRQALEAVPKTAVLISDLEAAHGGVIAAQPPTKSAIKKLTRLLGTKDDRHDRIVRGIEHRLLSELEVIENPELREQIAELLAAVLATGRSITTRSYVEESGEGPLRAGRVTEAHRAILRRLTTAEGVTLEQLYDELQQLAAEIGAIETQRTDLTDARRRLTKRYEARNRWIAVINGIASMLQLAGVDEKPILGELRKAAAKAALRTGDPDDADEADDETDTEATDANATDTELTDTELTEMEPTGTDVNDPAADDELDPPVLADDPDDPTDPTS